MHSRTPTILLGLCLTAFMAGCTKSDTAIGQAVQGGSGKPAAPGGPGAAPPVTVKTTVLAPRDWSVRVNAHGTVVPLSAVEVRPQVTAPVRELKVREGQQVRRGDVLMVLDMRQEEAAMEKAAAQVQRGEAALADLQRQRQRSLDLQKQGFVSQGALDSVNAQWDAAQANLAADRAAWKQASVLAGYARIVAPQSGRIGAVAPRVGSLVSPAAPVLTVTQMDPVAVQFSLPQRHVQDALAQLAGASKGDAAQGRVTVLPAQDDLSAAAPAPAKDGAAASTACAASARSATATLDFVDSQVDSASGTVRARARLANAGQCWWPGSFVRVQMDIAHLKGVMVIPQAAVVQQAKGRSVYVVDAEGKAQLKPVEWIHAEGEEAAVRGLSAGDRVVVEGRQQLRPGSVVKEQGAKP